MTLNLLWFVILGLLLTGYAVLDGFDLGVGILHPLARNASERRTFLSAIGPLWDGNEVWLVAFGGALFAAFPEAYATALSAYYAPFTALLFALIFRAVSIEFRSKLASPTWQRACDWGFFAASLLASLLLGFLVAGTLQGIPLDARGVFTGGLGDLVTPYSLLVALLTAALFAMHGAIYLYLKTGGAVQERLHNWMWHTWGVFLVLYVLTTMYTLLALPHAADNARRFPGWATLIAVVSVLAVAYVPRAIFHGRYFRAFVASSLTIATMTALFGVALFPDLIVARNDPAHTLTIYNAASSEKTLTIMLVVAVIGMPFALAYTGIVYWTFRGKVREDDHHY